MVLAYIAWGGSSDELHCGPHKWSPMIPQIASLYAPNGIKPNDLRPIVWVVCFLPWRPTSLLPTMDKDIPAGYLTERWHYFIAEIFMLCAVVGAILEVAAFIVNRVQRKPGGELSEPLLFEVQNRKTRPSRRMWYALSFAMWYVVYQMGLYIAMDIMVMCGMISLETGPDWNCGSSSSRRSAPRTWLLVLPRTSCIATENTAIRRQCLPHVCCPCWATKSTFSRTMWLERCVSLSLIVRQGICALQAWSWVISALFRRLSLGRVVR